MPTSASLIDNLDIFGLASDLAVDGSGYQVFTVYLSQVTWTKSVLVSSFVMTPDLLASSTGIAGWILM